MNKKPDWQKEAQKVRESVLEHKRKMETDPEYKERYEKLSAEVDKILGWTEYFKHMDD